MAFSVKAWQDAPSTSTPITAAALQDIETRLSAYSNTLDAAQTLAAAKKANLAVNAKDYGAVGLGLTNDDVLLQLGANAAAGGVLEIPDGTYLLAGGLLTIPINTAVVCHKDAVFKPSGTSHAVQFAPSSPTAYVPATTYALTSNTTEGAMTVTLSLPNMANFAVGDMVNISDTTALSTETPNREVNIVYSIVGTTMTLLYPLNFAYLTANSASIANVNPAVNTHWYGGRFDMTGTSSGVGDRDPIFCAWGKDSSINDIVAHNYPHKAAEFYGSLGCHIRRTTAYAPSATSSGEGYGPRLTYSRHCSIQGVWGRNIRHGADVSGGSDHVVDHVYVAGRTSSGTSTGPFLHGLKSKRVKVHSCISVNVGQGFAAGNSTFGADYDFDADVISDGCDYGALVRQGCTGFRVKGDFYDSVTAGAWFSDSTDGEADIKVDGVTTGASSTGAIDITGTCDKLRIRPIVRNSIKEGVRVTLTAGGGAITIIDPDIDQGTVAFAAIGIAGLLSGQECRIRGGRLTISEASATSAIEDAGLAGAIVNVLDTVLLGTGLRGYHASGATTDRSIRPRIRGTFGEQVRVEAGSLKVQSGSEFSSSGTAVRATGTTSAVFLGSIDWNGAGTKFSNTASPLATLTGEDSISAGVARMQTVATNANFTLTPQSSPELTLHTGTLTANRAVALSTTNAYQNGVFRVTRTGTGAFTLDVGTGPLKSLATNTWAEFTYDTTAGWFLSSYGAL